MKIKYIIYYDQQNRKMKLLNKKKFKGKFLCESLKEIA